MTARLAVPVALPFGVPVASSGRSHLSRSDSVAEPITTRTLLLLTGVLS